MSGWIYVETSVINCFIVGTSSTKCLENIMLLIERKPNSYILSSTSSPLQMVTDGIDAGTFSTLLWSWYKVRKKKKKLQFCAVCFMFTSFLHLYTTRKRLMNAMEFPFFFSKQLLYHVALTDGKCQMEIMWGRMFLCAYICVNLLVIKDKTVSNGYLSLWLSTINHMWSKLH